MPVHGHVRSGHHLLLPAWRERRPAGPGQGDKPVLLRSAANVDELEGTGLDLGGGEAAEEVHGTHADLEPLAELGVADPFERGPGLASAERDQDRVERVRLGRCDRGVPDRPAVTRLDSLIARVDRQDERPPAARQNRAEPRMGCLAGEVAAVGEGPLLRRGHDGGSES
jgi:hypothetical protein